MSVTLQEVLGAARARSALLPAEVSGYVALAVAEQNAVSRRSVTASDVELGPDGAVRVTGGGSTDPDGAEASVRGLLNDLLMESSSVSGAMLRIASRRGPAGMDALVREVEASLIPVNRGAGRRALSRLYRDTNRARENGLLEVAPEAESRQLPNAEAFTQPPEALPEVVEAAVESHADYYDLAAESSPEVPASSMSSEALGHYPALAAAGVSEDWSTAEDETTCPRRVAAPIQDDESDLDDYVEVVFSPTPARAQEDESRAAFEIPDLELPADASPGAPDAEPFTAPETVVALRASDDLLGESTTGGCSLPESAPPLAVDGQLLSCASATPVAPLIGRAPEPVIGSRAHATPTLFHSAEDATERVPMVMERSPLPPEAGWELSSPAGDEGDYPAVEGSASEVVVEQAAPAASSALQANAEEDVVDEASQEEPAPEEASTEAASTEEAVSCGSALRSRCQNTPAADECASAEVSTEEASVQALSIEAARVEEIGAEDAAGTLLVTDAITEECGEDELSTDDLEPVEPTRAPHFTSFRRDLTPLPPLTEPAASHVVAHQSSVDDLLETFSVADVGEPSELCRGLKELAGIDATGLPPAVEDCTPPPVAVAERDDEADSVAAPGHPAPLVGALALLLAIGVAGSSALPHGSVPELRTGIAAAHFDAQQLSRDLHEERRCAAEVVVRDVPRGAAVSARGGPELSSVIATRTSKHRAVFSKLPCGEALEVTVRNSRSGRWLTIPVSAERLSPRPGAMGRVRVTLIAR